MMQIQRPDKFKIGQFKNYKFKVEQYKEPLILVLHDLLELVREIESRNRDSKSLTKQSIERKFYKILKRQPKEKGVLFKKSELVYAFRAYQKEFDWPDALLALLRKKPTRTRSGVVPITVLTKPFPCPGDCIFCPNDVKMPKSYLSSEPGCQRAALSNFDPYLQCMTRMQSLFRTGHTVEKIELIVLGGTFSSYPLEYRRFFIGRLFDAVNDFDPLLGAFQEFEEQADLVYLTHCTTNEQTKIEGKSISHIERIPYNEQLKNKKRSTNQDSAVRNDYSWDKLEEIHRVNEGSKSRVVGLSVETRPDQVNDKELIILRRLGVTKLQLGIQSLNDAVLKINKRGHTAEQSRRAVEKLRSFAFKIQLHWMVNLLSATPQTDAVDFRQLFSQNHGLHPDELKFYPCALIDDTELMQHYKKGKWRAYNYQELLSLVTLCLELTPRYCRLSRVIRDISASDVVIGNTKNNLKEDAEHLLLEKGKQASDIRSREIALNPDVRSDKKVKESIYELKNSREYFLEIENIEGKILAFLRLSLPRDSKMHVLEELKDAALIREVHVYGAALAFGKKQKNASQHQGFGRILLDRAIAIAKIAEYKKIVVISSVGTRKYYRKNGFWDGELYQSITLMCDI